MTPAPSRQRPSPWAEARRGTSRGRAWLRAWLAAPLLLAMLASAQAHLMVAQRGTLNIVGDGAYLVLSLPVAAFSGIDDDGDGALSVAEMRTHGAAIETQVRDGVQLADEQGLRPLEGLMLNLSPGDAARRQAAATQLVVLGRFALEPGHAPRSFTLGLFGTSDAERRQEIVVTRGGQAQHMVLAPGRTQQVVLPSAWATFVDHAALGAGHVLGGMDHLLFLLVVLAAGWGLRQTVLALTSFTAGHAITLFGVVWGGWSVPSAIVEPAIAATIVGMAMFDLRSRLRAQPWPPALRLLLVFGCALVHGLGLAGALTDLGLDHAHRLWSLAGFNVGVEAAQLAVALLVALALALGTRWRTPRSLPLAQRLASLTAIAIGAAWCVQRVATAIAA